MGLDANVFCDCVEKNRLTTPYPYPRLLSIAPNGSPKIRSRDPRKIADHDDWMNRPPCRHEQMILAGCSVGTAGFVSGLRDALSAGATARLCPTLLKKVLFSGTHCGDYLTVRDVRRLADELDRIRQLNPAALAVAPRDRRQMIASLERLGRLAAAALKVRKPIAF